MELVECKGYRIRVDLYYDGERNLWVQPLGDGRFRFGFDPLGVEVNGTLAQLIIEDSPRRVVRGEPIGSVEAEKFVGPFESPLSGRVTAVNAALASNLGGVYEDCYATWLVELAEVDEAEPSHLIQPANAVAEFAIRVERFKKAGALAW